MIRLGERAVKEPMEVTYTNENEGKGYVKGLIIAASAVTLLAGAAAIAYFVNKEIPEDE